MSESTAEIPSQVCDDLPRVICFNAAKVDQLRDALPGPELLDRASALLKAAGHPGRLAVLWLLSEQECCVCDLAHTLGLPISTASQHLRRLRAGGLVRSRKEGKLVFYAIEDVARDLLSRSLTEGER